VTVRFAPNSGRKIGKLGTARRLKRALPQGGSPYLTPRSITTHFPFPGGTIAWRTHFGW
jgi:hypothetical protein